MDRLRPAQENIPLAPRSGIGIFNCSYNTSLAQKRQIRFGMLHFRSTNVNNLSAAEVRQIFLKMFFCVFPSAKLSWTHILTLSPLLHNVVCITSSSIGLSMQLNKTCDLGDARAKGKPTSWVSAITARYLGKQGRASWNGSAVLRFSSNSPLLRMRT